MTHRPPSARSTTVGDADDRRAIFHRRALFLGSALAALGSCQKTTTPTETAAGPVVAVPEGKQEDAGAVPETDADVPPREGGGLPRGEMPSLEMPQGISELARGRYEHLYSTMKHSHELLDQIESEVPRCSIERCEGEWQPIAKKLFALDDGFRFYGCPGSSAEAKAYGERQKEHFEFFDRRKKEVLAWLTTTLGDAGFAKLDELVQKEHMANPRPCLSIACLDW